MYRAVKHKLVSVSLLGLCVFAFQSIAIQAKNTDVSESTSNHQLTLATSRWCPYTCDNNAGEFGVIGRYLTLVFGQLNVELTIVSYPWSPAIKLAENGQVDGLLTAIPTEAPFLIFTNSAISTYRMCFFTKPENPWRYKDSVELKKTD